MNRKKNPSFTMIPCVYASDMPSEVIDWCEMHEYSTHYNNSIVVSHGKDNEFIRWAKSLGIKPDCYKIGDKKYEKWIVAIIAT